MSREVKSVSFVTSSGREPFPFLVLLTRLTMKISSVVGTTLSLDGPLTTFLSVGSVAPKVSWKWSWLCSVCFRERKVKLAW